MDQQSAQFVSPNIGTTGTIGIQGPPGPKASVAAEFDRQEAALARAFEEVKALEEALAHALAPDLGAPPELGDEAFPPSSELVRTLRANTSAIHELASRIGKLAARLEL